MPTSVILFAQYDGAINAGDFAPLDFITAPAGHVPDSVSQSGANGLQLFRSSGWTGQTLLAYSGSAPGVLTPDTHPIT